MQKKWRLVDSGLADPFRVTAIDDAMTVARSQDAVPDTLHIYRRNSPTISVGFSKRLEEDINLDFCRKEGIKIVRRASGGGTIYTDENQLIYALVTKGFFSEDVEKSFARICGSLVSSLRKLGLNAEYKPVNDVLIKGKKVSGSAQTRKLGVVLQHGTIIVDFDFEKAERALKSRGMREKVTSLKKELGYLPDFEKVKHALVEGFEEAFDVEFEEGRLADCEEKLVKKLIEEKYGNREWNLRR